MSVLKKASFSFFISVFLIAGFSVIFAFFGIFSMAEKYFIRPAIRKNLVQQTAFEGEMIGDLLFSLQEKFSSVLHHPSVQSGFLSAQADEIIYARSKLFGALQDSIPHLISVRFIESNGINIHYSTYEPDIIASDDNSIAYRNYTDDPKNIPFNKISVSENENCKITIDDSQDNIIFAFPFFDLFDIYRGNAVFTVSARAVFDVFIAAGKLEEQMAICPDSLGIVCGIPNNSRNEILAVISALWNNSDNNINFIESEDVSLVLVSVLTGYGFNFGRIFASSVFVVPFSGTIILLIIFFITVYLIIFFFFNFKHDNVLDLAHFGTGETFPKRHTRQKKPHDNAPHDNAPLAKAPHDNAPTFQNRDIDYMQNEYAASRSAERKGNSIPESNNAAGKELDDKVKIISGRGLLLAASFIADQKNQNPAHNSQSFSGWFDYGNNALSMEPADNSLVPDNESSEIEELELVEDDDDEQADAGVLPEQYVKESVNIEEITSRIEFSQNDELSSEGDVEIVDVEVVSPLLSMSSKNNFDDAELEEIFEKNISGKNSGGAFMYKPFSLRPGNPDILPSVSDNSNPADGAIPKEELNSSKNIIYEHEGIHYINSNSFKNNSNANEKLEENFLELVESVVNISE